MGKILEIMRSMNDKNDTKEKGVFVMNRETIKRFRKESNSFGAVFMGHRVRRLKSCPEDKIYLMSDLDYLELKTKVEGAVASAIKKSCERLPEVEKTK